MGGMAGFRNLQRNSLIQDFSQIFAMMNKTITEGRWLDLEFLYYRSGFTGNGRDCAGESDSFPFNINKSP